MAIRDLTSERLRELLHYDSATGLFTWRAVGTRSGTTAGNSRFTGKLAGSKLERPNTTYTRIKVEQRYYLAHRLAWFYVHGKWPEGVIDHRDGNGTNNRIENLRDVPQQVNLQNMRRFQRKGQSSGLLGASWHEEAQKWRAVISVNKKQIYIGHFDSAEDAHRAYLEAKRRLHEGCTI